MLPELAPDDTDSRLVERNADRLLPFRLVWMDPRAPSREINLLFRLRRSTFIVVACRTGIQMVLAAWPRGYTVCVWGCRGTARR